MALRRNSFLTGMLIAAACLSSPVLADDSAITDREDDNRSEYLDNNYIYDYMTRRDSITVGLGDAPTSNIVIQHPTPWPSYINNTDIKTSGAQGVSALDRMMQSYLSSGGSSSTATADTPTSGTSVGMSGGN
jgi:hypothetical protein